MTKVRCPECRHSFDVPDDSKTKSLVVNTLTAATMILIFLLLGAVVWRIVTWII